MEYYISGLKNYAKFDGRASRREYWYFVLFNFLASFGLGFIEGLMDLPQFLSTVYSLAVLVPSVAVGVRRMHDVGKSGWYLLIPLYNLYLAVLPGEKKANSYGKAV